MNIKETVDCGEGTGVKFYENHFEIYIDSEFFFATKYEDLGGFGNWDNNFFLFFNKKLGQVHDISLSNVPKEVVEEIKTEFVKRTLVK